MILYPLSPCHECRVIFFFFVFEIIGIIIIHFADLADSD